MIKEVIVVEGRDDVTALKRALDCECRCTNGYAFDEKLLLELKKINANRGIIVFTDPDYAGNRIRARIKEYIPNCKHAFLDRNKALKKGDIGIENASDKDIIAAIAKSRPVFCDRREEFSIKDLIDNNLNFSEIAKFRRMKLTEELGIGYCNAKQLLKRLNEFGITREEFNQAISRLNNEKI